MESKAKIYAHMIWKIQVNDKFCKVLEAAEGTEYIRSQWENSSEK